MSSERPGVDKTREKLLVVAEDLIAARGFERSTVSELCRRAAVTEKVFHTYFDGMDAVLHALFATWVRQMHTVTEEATRSGIWKGSAARDVIEVAVRSVLDVILERPALVRAFLTKGDADPGMMAELRGIGTRLAERIVAVLAECRDVPVQPERSVAFSLLVAVSLAHHYALIGDEWSGASFTAAQLSEETSRMICAYLGLGPTIRAMGELPDGAPTGEVPTVEGPASRDR
ncbi:MAG: TetR/AcrR family transcriptional regulator [Myxococcales bacterium]|nr:TetR/AcrR family transcriptional regulator [Myxococcales bacterium]